MAIWSNPKIAVRVPDIHVPAVSLGSLRGGMAWTTQVLVRAGRAAFSPTAWWARITSVTGVATLLGFCIVTLIAGLIVTWPR